MLEAHDGPSALRLLEDQPRVDLLFTDAVLPSGMTRAQVAKQTRTIQPNLRVLFTTGYAAMRSFIMAGWTRAFT